MTTETKRTPKAVSSVEERSKPGSEFPSAKVAKNNEAARPRNWLVPATLLALREANSYGYELAERMAKFGFEAMSPGTLYRTLRHIEKDGASRRTEPRPPERRTYDRYILTAKVSGHDNARLSASRPARTARRCRRDRWLGRGSWYARGRRRGAPRWPRTRGRPTRRRDRRAGEPWSPG